MILLRCAIKKSFIKIQIKFPTNKIFPVKQHKKSFSCNFRKPLKTPKSRLAAEAKAEFTNVNEPFAEGA